MSRNFVVTYLLGILVGYIASTPLGQLKARVCAWSGDSSSSLMYCGAVNLLEPSIKYY